MSEQILIVDDEKEIADLIEVYLKNDGYTVHKFYNGLDALECIETQKMDLAILDVMLPDIDGFRICQKIREQYFYPIIILTAKVEDTDKIMGLTIGADDYITKPFNPLEVVARVKTQLRRYVRYNNAANTKEIDAPIAEHDVRGLIINKNTLEQRKLAAELSEQRKNDLVVYLAHDLKTPLTSVIGYLTLLRDENKISEELREKYLSISLEKAEHLEDLINEFFEITRFNLSNITLEYSRVNLTRMLEQLTYEFKPMFLEKNLKCELEIAPDTMIKCDVNKMQRVFDNLLRNAVNYSFDDSTIHIAVKQNGENLCIQFTNCGNTIPKEKLVRIFEQFYRLDVARSSRSGGAGLGLAVAKEIVELHNGTITAKSENEQIEFTVTFPLL